MNSGFDFATCSLDMLRMSIVKDLEGMRSGRCGAQRELEPFCKLPASDEVILEFSSKAGLSHLREEEGLRIAGSAYLKFSII